MGKNSKKNESKLRTLEILEYVLVEQSDGTLRKIRPGETGENEGDIWAGWSEKDLNKLRNSDIPGQRVKKIYRAMNSVEIELLLRMEK
jgi:hypothetical protein